MVGNYTEMSELPAIYVHITPFGVQGDIIKEKSDPIETESLLVGAEGVEPPTLCL